MDREAFVDRLYEAAVVPEFWPDVLRMIGEIAGARGAILLTSSAADLRWVASAEVHDDMTAFAEGGWHSRNTRLPRLLAAQHAGFLREIDIFDTAEEIDQDHNIRDFLRPRGLGWGAGSAIPVPSGDFLIYSIEREFKHGSIEDEAIAMLDRLRPDLARAALMSARLALQRAQVATDALGGVGLPAAVLRDGGRVHAANPLFQSLMPDVIQDRRERLTLTDQAADGLFAKALARGYEAGAGPVVCSVPLAAFENRLPMIVHVLPVRRSAHDIFSHGTTIVVITPVDRAKVATAEVLQGLFDLTPAEARAARAIAAGQSVAQIATAGKVSSETVRTHVKAVLAKTGLNRQTDLAALLAGTVLGVL